ncbi:lymphokine-activated killer T-cell-originated protein kinase isoform X1 [Marmota marmota marmota]|uniref:Protein kinase domain-containing protein n=2 Tax=Marmota marmota marmota TaxID=9994 RepID=A0A8C5ZFT7_MARMA|nr:lymphokine-activated killer T-cell-originated protein kinase isoform X1 [Marmota marmota marmota]XP_048657475.1 lymphokine-activated killer T-cell-originated protein kinase isoform X1 [Marmota marmota marmota]XP_048657476.1 lymphokine-activated killer T-cell-originated protein kinase isoform X1 [Marmota marmota marmota]XP_048657477.1 lymphokine-activated killer T-cell-originated protein kinase isoform X1 [Marmota marmota marmota]
MEGTDNFKTPSKLSEKRKSVLCPTPYVTIPASPFMQKLGFGTGVNVYLMKRSPRGLSHSPWAVKKINPICSDDYRSIYQKRLIDEAKILKSLHHPNIVGYRAFTEASDGSLCLAMEYGGEKSLNDLIEERNKDSQHAFPAAVILKVALNMAKGLKYLHQEKKLLHGDIKSSNVVIKGDFETIKICDVGVSLPLDENMTVTDPEACYIGTEPWKPKEALEENGIITDKADIFAYGLTLWEMMTLSIPHFNFDDDDDDDEDKTFDEDDFNDEAYYAALGTRPPINMEELDESYQKVIELFSVCTNEDPKDRPSAARIVEALELDGQ